MPLLHSLRLASSSGRYVLIAHPNPPLFPLSSPSLATSVQRQQLLLTHMGNAASAGPVASIAILSVALVAALITRLFEKPTQDRPKPPLQRPVPARMLRLLPELDNLNDPQPGADDAGSPAPLTAASDGPQAADNDGSPSSTSSATAGSTAGTRGETRVESQGAGAAGASSSTPSETGDVASDWVLLPEDPYDFDAILTSHGFNASFSRARHIAFFGCQGSGKTTLVGLLRGMCDTLHNGDDPSSADIHKLLHKAYQRMCAHPSTRPTVEDDQRQPTPFMINEHLFIWDMPGGGTRRLPSEHYAAHLDIARFACAVVVVALTDTEVANNIVDYLHERQMPVAVVQTHFDAIVAERITTDYVAAPENAYIRPPDLVNGLLEQRRKLLTDLLGLKSRDRLFCVNLKPTQGSVLLHGPLLQPAHAHPYELLDALKHIVQQTVEAHQ